MLGSTAGPHGCGNVIGGRTAARSDNDRPAMGVAGGRLAGVLVVPGSFRPPTAVRQGRDARARRAGLASGPTTG